MKKITYAIAIFLFTTGIVSARGFHQSNHYQPKPVRPPVTKPVTPPITPPVTSGSEVSFIAYLTSYASGDNDPAGSTATYISGIAGNAGGTGTYTDPITMATGYVGEKPDYPAGTMFYVSSLQKYFKVEDTCADCHKTPKGVTAWLDMYAGNYSGSGVLACEDAVTGDYTVIENPKATYPTVVGTLYNGKTCVK